jgi:hypothetical protein
MEPLPKIARERLQRSPVSEHPDADLLTAFAEQSLTERERSQVADHVSHCGECREVLVIASPVDTGASSASAANSITRRKSRLLSWPVLRWGAVAACVVVVSAAGLLLTRRTSGPEKLDGAPQQENTQVAVDQHPSASTMEYSAPAAQPEARKQSLDFSAKAEAPAASKLPGTPANRKKFIALSEERAAKDSAALLALSPGVNEKGEMDKLSQAAPAVGSPSRIDADGVATAQSAPVAPPQSAAAGAVADEKTGAASAPAATAASNKEAQQNRPQVPSETLEVTADVAVVQAQTATLAKKAQSKTKPDRSEAKSDAGNASGTVSSDLAATAAMTSGSRLMRDVSSARWTLSPDGLPQRSFDSGKTWEKMQVDHHTGFRALSAQGMDVWVGGLAGILYHSSDVGMHWTRIVPVAENTTLASDIVSMDFRDRSHGKLMTGTRESWTTSDGGKTWQKE